MAPGLASMKVFKLAVIIAFTVPSALSTSIGYRAGAVVLPGQADPSIMVLPGQQVVVVSSTSRRFAFCQYPLPVEEHPVIHGTHIIPPWEGPEMLLMLVVIWGLVVLN